MKVLIVDDVGLIRHGLSRIIEQQGFTTASAKSGADAVEAIRADNNIGVVITDLLMPGMTGIELFSAVQSIERINDQGVVAPPDFVLMTAMRPAESGYANLQLQMARDLGFAGVIHKPVDQNELRRILKMLKQKRQGEVSISGERLDSLLQSIQQVGDLVVSSGNVDLIENYRATLRLQLDSAERALDLLFETSAL